MSLVQDGIQLASLLKNVDEMNLNFELSRKGQNPDGSWQYWATLWQPFGGKNEVVVMGVDLVSALARALEMAGQDKL